MATALKEKESATKSFTVQARMWVESTIDISAKTLADAVEQSKTLGLNDFITVDGENNDNGFRVTGIFETWQSSTQPKI